MVAACRQNVLRRRHLAVLVVVSVVLLMSLWVQIPLVVEQQVGRLDVGSISVTTTMGLATEFLSLEATAGSEGGETITQDLTARREHYQAVCDAMQASGGVPGGVQNPLVYLPANLSVCWVPKVGCTLWKRVFFYLYNDTGSPWRSRPVESPFDVDRLFVHFDGDLNNKTLRFDDARERDVILHTRRVMFARDPWSRLWSCYIDKFVLPDSWLDHGKRILRMRGDMTANVTQNRSQPTGSVLRVTSQKNNTNDGSVKCADDVSFAEFLRYALLVNHDPHWSPVHLTCNPCLFRPHVLGKFHTFARDLSHVLLASGLGRLLPRDLSHSSHVTDEVKLLVDYHFRLWAGRRGLHACLDRLGLARRLWRGFQLNGYLPVTSPFPERLLTRQLNDVTMFAARDRFVERVLAVSSASSLSRPEWRALRRRTMAEAYRTVPRQLLELVQERFRLDFELFQYDPAPSDLF